MLQKTLLNIEGLGRQLDPELDLWNTAKPFLEKWMVDQLGPKKLLMELRDQAPQYAKLLPQLPRLLHAYLQQPQGQMQERKHLDNLIAEQRRTNRMLQTILYLSIGFVVASVALQLLMRLDLL